jgi:GntP family permease
MTASDARLVIAGPLGNTARVRPATRLVTDPRVPGPLSLRSSPGLGGHGCLRVQERAPSRRERRARIRWPTSRNHHRYHRTTGWTHGAATNRTGQRVQDGEATRAPSFGWTLITVLSPVVLMLPHAAADLWLAPGSTVHKVFNLIGDPVVALLIAVLLAMITFGTTVRFSASTLGLRRSVRADCPSWASCSSSERAGAGSVFFSHVNDAGVWLVKKYFGLTVWETVRTWSVMEP